MYRILASSLIIIIASLATIESDLYDTATKNPIDKIKNSVKPDEGSKLNGNKPTCQKQGVCQNKTGNLPPLPLIINTKKNAQRKPQTNILSKRSDISLSKNSFGEANNLKNFTESMNEPTVDDIFYTNESLIENGMAQSDIVRLKFQQSTFNQVKRIYFDEAFPSGNQKTEQFSFNEKYASDKKNNGEMNPNKQSIITDEKVIRGKKLHENSIIPNNTINKKKNNLLLNWNIQKENTYNNKTLLHNKFITGFKTNIVKRTQNTINSTKSNNNSTLKAFWSSQQAEKDREILSSTAIPSILKQMTTFLSSVKYGLHQTESTEKVNSYKEGHNLGITVKPELKKVQQMLALSAISPLQDSTLDRQFSTPYSAALNATFHVEGASAIFSNSTAKILEIPWPVKKEAVVEGDLVLGGLMMVHEREDSVTCGPVMPQGGIQALEAMLYTLDRLNYAAEPLLANITLGAHILDDCDKDTYGLEMAVDFIKGFKQEKSMIEGSSNLKAPKAPTTTKQDSFQNFQFKAPPIALKLE